MVQYSWRSLTELLVCLSAIYCGMIPLVENAYVSSATGVQYQDTVTYECFGGYGFNGGDPTVTCQEDGTWTVAPTCTGEPLNTDLRDSTLITTL